MDSADRVAQAIRADPTFDSEGIVSDIQPFYETA